jgi:GNAT superfamily N-acetyltransferase
VPPPVAAAAAFGISYRAEMAGDLPFVAALYATTRAEELAATGWPETMKSAFLEQQHRAQHAHYRAVHPDGEWLLIVDISLLPAARGGGLGTAILTDLLAAETRPAQLHVELTNPARRLYERLGFELVETQAFRARMIRP